MGLIKFYKSGNVWVLGEYDGIPAGSLIRKVDSSTGIVSIQERVTSSSKPNTVIYAGLPTNFCGANGVAYPDLATFKSATDDFFVKASASTGATGGGSDIVVSPTYTTDGQDDGNGNITGTTRFVLPVNADISKDVWAYEGGILNLGFTKNVPLLAIDFLVAPLSGNGITIFYHKK